LAIVSPEMPAVTPLLMAKTLKSDDGPPPEIVSDDAPGPAMVTLELITNPLLRVIVPVSPEVKVMVGLPPSVAALASASRRLVTPSLELTTSVVVVTTRLGG
jgi:hypothetical protein